MLRVINGLPLPAECLKYNSSTWMIYNLSSGLADTIIDAIATDAQGNIWLGTNGGWISKYDGTKVDKLHQIIVLYMLLP